MKQVSDPVKLVYMDYKYFKGHQTAHKNYEPFLLVLQDHIWNHIRLLQDLGGGLVQKFYNRML